MNTRNSHSVNNESKPTKLLIVGRTGSGKDYVANIFSESFGMKILRSYTTRPKRSDNDNGHIFISENDVDKYRNDMIAYTKIGEFEYFSTKSQLEDNDIYIIDPAGIKYLLEKSKDDFDFVIVYILAGSSVRLIRAINRTDNKDEKNITLKRNIAESYQFDEFEKLLSDKNFSYNGKNCPIEVICNESHNGNISKDVENIYNKYFK